MFLRRLALLLLTAFCSALLAPCASGEPPQVRVVGDGVVTRVTVFGSVPADAGIYLSETHSTQSITVDMPGMTAPDTPTEPVNAYTGVSGYSWQGGQLVLDLARPMMVARRLDLPPTGSESRHRLVLDLAGVSDVRFARRAKRDATRLVSRLAEREQRLAELQAADTPAIGHGRYVVVIDPGHGGKDPGAQAVTGSVEKTIVLSAALELRDLMARDPRYDVRLTREGDVYIPLEDRVSLAREWGADLFISLHADAAGSSAVEGASVYTLSSRGEGRIDREARKNNWSMPIESGVPDDVSGILQDLIKRETKTNSGVFAELLLPELEKAGPVLRNTHRNAGFYVLLAPDVPAVLLEIGFLTNKTDALRLASKDGRRKSIAAVKAAIDAYFDRQDIVYAQN